MLKKMVNTDELIVALNNALAWELRAIAMYAHYSAYVSGFIDYNFRYSSIMK